MTKKYIFIAEDFLWHGIGDEPIFITQMSQIMKDDENTTFSDIYETSQKLICVVVLSIGLSWFTATTLVLSTCLPIPYSISGPNMLRLIFTLFGSVLLLELSAFFMFLPVHSTPTSSPKACRLRCSRSFGPVWTSRLPTIRLQGGVRHYICVCCVIGPGVYCAWAMAGHCGKAQLIRSAGVCL